MVAAGWATAAPCGAVRRSPSSHDRTAAKRGVKAAAGTAGTAWPRPPSPPWRRGHRAAGHHEGTHHEGTQPDPAQQDAWRPRKVVNELYELLGLLGLLGRDRRGGCTRGVVADGGIRTREAATASWKACPPWVAAPAAPADTHGGPTRTAVA